MSFDLSRGQKAFLMGCWLGSALYSLGLLAWDQITGRKP